ncbi:C-type isolectin Sp-CL4-like [Diadema setosum]|uniref:C-type isolectin Sp-CL4-like n=1 Tax=Diadema setosum TaxID=31175 RepID=UPI003B3AD0C7
MLVDGRYRCQDGWRQYKDRCYLLVLKTTSQAKAKELCLQEDAALPEILSELEAKFVASLLEPVTVTSTRRAWLDCYREASGSSVWVCGDDRHPAQYLRWISNQPNNAGGNEDCSEISQFGKFNDLSCTHERIPLCVKPARIRGFLVRRMLSPHQGVCLPDHVIESIQSSSRIRCVAACLAMPECVSMNIHPMDGTCQLNNATRTSALSAEPSGNCEYLEL